MTELTYVGTLTEIDILVNEFGQIKSPDVIITNERVDHIRTRHPDDYELFEAYSQKVLSEPDAIIKDCKSINTVFIIKKTADTNRNVVVKLILENEESAYKNSVMTFYRIRDKNLNKLINKNKMLYKKK